MYYVIQIAVRDIVMVRSFLSQDSIEASIEALKGFQELVWVGQSATFDICVVDICDTEVEAQTACQKAISKLGVDDSVV